MVDGLIVAVYGLPVPVALLVNAKVLSVASVALPLSEIAPVPVLREVVPVCAMLPVNVFTPAIVWSVAVKSPGLDPSAGDSCNVPFVIVAALAVLAAFTDPICNILLAGAAIHVEPLYANILLVVEGAVASTAVP